MSPLNKALDRLLDDSRIASDTGYAHVHFDTGRYGVTVIVRDAEPGKARRDVIAAGSGPTLYAAVIAAQIGLESLRGTWLSASGGP